MPDRKPVLVAAIALIFGLLLLALFNMASLAAQAGNSERQYLPLITTKSRCSVAIMPLGDSITQGYGGSQMVGYRQHLYNALDDAGYNVNFVGSRKAGLPLDFDRDNESHPGERAGYIRDNIKAYLKENHPDIILLHIGTNDIPENEGYKVIAAEIDQILTEIYTVDKDIVVFLARIINRVDTDARKEKTTKLNEEIQQIADQRIKNGDPLVVVDMESALTYTYMDTDGTELLVDMYDRGHPNDSGYKKMAVVWDDALQGYLHSYCSTEHAAKITSSAGNNAYINAPYNYLVEASGNPAPTFSLAHFPSGMTIDPDTGLIAWTPVAAGDVTVVVNASNSVAPDVEQTFVIHVAETSPCPAETIVYYHLDESSPPFAGALRGPAPTCSDCPAPTGGKVNNALLFDGSGSALNVAGDNALFDWQGKDDSFSIEFWMRRPGSCTASTFDLNEVAVGRADASSNLVWWVGLSCQHQGRARFAMRDSDSDNSDSADVVSQTALSGGDWHHVVAVRDWPAMDLRIYVDGVIEGITLAVFSSDFKSASAALNIGWLNRSNGFHFQGTIDEVALYNRVLTDNEIRHHYAAGRQGKPYCSAANTPTMSRCSR